MSSNNPPIGPIDRNTWYTMRELRSGMKDFRKENVNGVYDDNVRLYETAFKQMLQEAVRKDGLQEVVTVKSLAA